MRIPISLSYNQKQARDSMLFLTWYDYRRYASNYLCLADGLEKNKQVENHSWFKIIREIYELKETINCKCYFSQFRESEFYLDEIKAEWNKSYIAINGKT